MILNADMFQKKNKHNSPKLVKQIVEKDDETPKKPQFRFDSFSGHPVMAGDSVNLMVRSSKKSCEKYRPPQIQKPTSKREVLDSP